MTNNRQDVGFLALFDEVNLELIALTFSSLLHEPQSAHFFTDRFLGQVPLVPSKTRFLKHFSN